MKTNKLIRKHLNEGIIGNFRVRTAKGREGLGTGLIGYIEAPFSKLVQAFGMPFEGNGDQTQVEWTLNVDGLYFSIYDWYEKTPFKRITKWHVGGSSREFAKHFFTMQGFDFTPDR